MKKKNNFPRDIDTLKVINEMEEYLQIPHKNIIAMNDWDLHEYINKLTQLFIRL